MPRQKFIASQFGYESTYGTEAASYQPMPGRVSSFQPTLKRELEAITDLSSIYEYEDAIHGKHAYGFSMEMRIANWRFLYWLMGGYSVSGAGPYTHSLSNSNPLPSISAEFVVDSDFSIKYLGAKLNSLKLSGVAGETIKASLDFLAKGVILDATPGSPTSPTDSPFHAKHDSVLTINALDMLSGNHRVERWEYQFENSLEADHNVGSNAPASITSGTRKAMASFDIRALDETFLNLLENETEFAISHTIQRGSNDNLAFTISKAKVEDIGYGPQRNVQITSLQARILGAWTAQAIDSIANYTT